MVDDRDRSHATGTTAHQRSALSRSSFAFRTYVDCRSGACTVRESGSRLTQTFVFAERSSASAQTGHSATLFMSDCCAHKANSRHSPHA